MYIAHVDLGPMLFALGYPYPSVYSFALHIHVHINVPLSHNTMYMYILFIGGLMQSLRHVYMYMYM